MISTRASVLRLTVMLVILAVPPASTVLMNGQEGQVKPADGEPRDWTHHHLVFSQPGSADEATRRGTYERWLKIVGDPRYLMQQKKRSATAPGAAEPGGVSTVEIEAGRMDARSDADIQAQEEARDNEMSLEERDAQFARRGLPSGLVRAIGPSPREPDRADFHSRPRTRNRMHKDWSETLGSDGTTGLGEFPAVYTTGATNCTDFAIYNTGLAGSSSQASIIAFNNLYSSCNGGAPTTYWAYNTTGGTIVNSAVLSLDGTQVAFVQSSSSVASLVLLKWKTGNSDTVSSPTSFTSTTQTYTGSGVNGKCSTTSGSPTVNCTGTSVNFAASEDSGAAVTVTGFTGTQVIVAVNSATQITLSGNAATTEASGSATVTVAGFSGTTTGFVSPANYPGCIAPCMTSLALDGGSSGSPNDTNSAPFIDYGFTNPSTIYVGDDTGVLHQFTNIFSSGTPAEVTAGGWPVTVNANASLASPTYDAVSTKVFVGDYPLSSSSSLCELFPETYPCGFLYSVNPSGTVGKSAQLDYNLGILDGPIVDSTTGEAFVFVGDDGSAKCTGGPCAAVYQFAANFSGGATGTEATVGPGYVYMMSGSFDNAYITSASNTGNLYVIGNTGPANNTLYQVPITNGVMSTSANAGPAVSSNYSNGYYSAALQVTEICQPGAHPCTAANGWTDYLLLSVLSFGSPTTGYCGTASLANGCVIGFNVTSGTINSSTTPTAAEAEAGGTSGIVVDNASAGAQNIYFSTLLNQCTGGTSGCAIQTSQSAP